HMRLIQRQHLPVSLTRVTEPGQGCSARGSRLFSKVMLVNVIAVQLIFFAELLAHVCGSLVNVHWCSGRPKKCRPTVQCTVGVRHQVEQGISHWTTGRLNRCSADLASRSGIRKHATRER